MIKTHSMVFSWSATNQTIRLLPRKPPSMPMKVDMVYLKQPTIILRPTTFSQHMCGDRYHHLLKYKIYTRVLANCFGYSKQNDADPFQNYNPVRTGGIFFSDLEPPRQLSSSKVNFSNEVNPSEMEDQPSDLIGNLINLKERKGIVT